MEEHSHRQGAGHGGNHGNGRQRNDHGGYRGNSGRNDRRGHDGKRSGGNGRGRGSNDRHSNSYRSGRDQGERRHSNHNDGNAAERRSGNRNGGQGHYRSDNRKRFHAQGEDERRGTYRSRDDRQGGKRDGRRLGGGHHGDRRGARGSRDDRTRRNDRREFSGRDERRDGRRNDDRRDDRNRRNEHGRDDWRDNRSRDNRRDGGARSFEREDGRRDGRNNQRQKKAERHGNMGGGMRERNRRQFERPETKPYGYDQRKHRDVDAERAEVFGTPAHKPASSNADHAGAESAPQLSVSAEPLHQESLASEAAFVQLSSTSQTATAGAAVEQDTEAASSSVAEDNALASTDPPQNSGQQDASQADAPAEGAGRAEGAEVPGVAEAQDGASPHTELVAEASAQRSAESTSSEERFDMRERDDERERTFFPEFFATCQGGMEDILARELKTFGIRKVRPLGGGVTFYAEKEKAYKALLWSRTASRILAVIDHVGCRDAEELYRNVRQMPWHRIIAPGSRIAVFAVGGNEDLRNTKFTSQKVKDAICDKIRQVTGERPDVDRKHPDAAISVRINRNRATVSFDLAGESLYQRSYIAHRSQNVTVDVALGNALLSVVNWRTLGYRRHYRLIDPVCNNPMLIVEAACLAADRAPGLTRSAWGFTGWGEHDEDLWNRLLDEADERFEHGLDDLSRLGALALGITRRPIVADQAAQYLRAAGVEKVGQVISVGEDTVGAAVDRAMHAANRAAESAIKRAEAENDTDKPIRQASVVAANLLPEHDADGLSVAKNAELFLRAAGKAPAGSTYAQLGSDLSAAYGHAPVEEHVVGGKRLDAPLQVFSKAPVPRTQITVVGLEDGIEHHVPVYEPGTEQFAARLRKMGKERRKWAQALGISCYRIYDADLLDYMVAIDRYEDVEGNVYLTIAEYAPPASVDQDRARRRFDDVVAIAPIVLGVNADHIFVKTRRQEKGGGQYRDAGTESKVVLVQEGGYTFEVDLGGRLDTGLFLDHRITRHLIEKQAAGKRFLNLFAYTGSASVYAAGGGARTTATVDMSGHYLEWAERNMERNGFTGKAHHFERSDVMAWLKEARRKHRRFDLIFVDPPTFSNSKKMGSATWDVQRDHFELLVGVVHILDPNGMAVFSCNLRNFKPDTWRLAHFGIDLKDITDQTIPQDFERHSNIHKCYLVHRMTPEQRDRAIARLEAERSGGNQEHSEQRRSHSDGPDQAEHAGNADAAEEAAAAGDSSASPESSEHSETGASSDGAPVAEPQRVSLELGTVPRNVEFGSAGAQAAGSDDGADSDDSSEPVGEEDAGAAHVTIEVGTVPAQAAALDPGDEDGTDALPKTEL